MHDLERAAHWLAMAADRGMTRAHFGVAAHELSRAATPADAPHAMDRIARGLEAAATAARRSRHDPLGRWNPIGAAYNYAGDSFACPEAAPRNWRLAVLFWLRAGMDGYTLGWTRLKRFALSPLSPNIMCYTLR
jgi:hypothetical protein